MQEYEKGYIKTLDQIGLPGDLKFGETNNPDGQNNYVNPQAESKPIFSLEISLVEDKANKLDFVKVPKTFWELKENFEIFDLSGAIIR